MSIEIEEKNNLNGTFSRSETANVMLWKQSCACQLLGKQVALACMLCYNVFCGTFPDYNIFAVEFSKLSIINVSKTQIGSRFPLFFCILLCVLLLIIVGRCCSFVAHWKMIFFPTIHEIYCSIVALEQNIGKSRSVQHLHYFSLS